ncbi:hypothetical protein BD769DRAFT_1697154 [Suillus cothurnatus]|nr:hypothetical protein BD769DRAFT_1697154 [Suillus cothurnatus]
MRYHMLKVLGDSSSLMYCGVGVLAYHFEVRWWGIYPLSQVIQLILCWCLHIIPDLIGSIMVHLPAGSPMLNLPGDSSCQNCGFSSSEDWEPFGDHHLGISQTQSLVTPLPAWPADPPLHPLQTWITPLSAQGIPRGWTTHRKACEMKADKRRRDQDIVDAIHNEKGPSIMRLDKHQPAVCIPAPIEMQNHQHNAEFEYNLDVDFDPAIDPPVLNEPKPVDAFPTFKRDDIKVKYHPNSGIEAKVCAFDAFERHPATSVPPPDGHPPWHPFKSRLEFDIAELTLEVGLNNEQSDRLIKLCHRCALGKEKVTFKNHKDIHSMWEAASHRITKFTKEVITVPFDGDGKSRDYEIHYRVLWELAADMLRNPRLFPHFVFDAHRFSKFDGNTFVSFVDEPFTARDIWDVQSQLPPGAKPLAFILYADKTKLSSFGTAKGYPVYARLANLPTKIRNGQGTGGGYVVGWLPIVNDEKLHSGKPSWVNFKNTVWHKSFSRILSSLASKSKTGQWFTCLDGIERWFFLCILILSADFEEQCVMALTRGLMSLWPCPVCLVSRDDLWDTSRSYRQRTSKESQALKPLKREELLKEQALRLIENALWAVKFTCVHRALLHDRCHFNHAGLWSRHLWVELQKLLAILGRDKVSQVDENFEKFPYWQNLKHPNRIVGVTFTDSSVHEDISKMIIYATHNIFTEHDSPLGYLLLRCTRLYIEMDIYAALEVHTANTITEGRHTVQAFTALIQQYITQTADDNEKNWNFPKLHMITHIFNDIEAKGASRNYNTKLNEQMHGPLKDWYLNRTNFKNVAEHILCIDHWLLVADDISRRISDFDEHSQVKLDDIDDELLGHNDDTVITGSPDANSFDPSLHVRIGSRQPAQTFDFIENAHQADAGFTNFRIKLNDFLSNFLPICNIPLPGGKRIHFQSDNTVTECRFLRVNYKSLVDWRQYTDYLRCNPQFFGAPRFDCVFIQTQQSIIIGRLVFVFECAVGNDLFPIALIHPFDAPTGLRLRKDKQLNIFRVRAKPRVRTEFFSVRSIIRGALLVQDDNSLDYLVVDTIDTDMFLRVRDMHLQAGHPQVDHLQSSIALHSALRLWKKSSRGSSNTLISESDPQTLTSSDHLITRYSCKMTQQQQLLDGPSSHRPSKFDPSAPRQNAKIVIELLSYSVVWWMLLAFVRLGLEVSRRMANISYVLWVTAYNTSFILGYIFLDMVFFPARTSKI